MWLLEQWQAIFTNAFTKVDRTRSQQHIIPGYDMYKLAFNACDKFNRKLHDKKWPHRYGGNTRVGDEGHHQKMALACILQNCFNAYAACGPIDKQYQDFKSSCIALSEELYALAETLD